MVGAVSEFKIKLQTLFLASGTFQKNRFWRLSFDGPVSESGFDSGGIRFTTEGCFPYPLLYIYIFFVLILAFSTLKILFVVVAIGGRTRKMA